MVARQVPPHVEQAHVGQRRARAAHHGRPHGVLRHGGGGALRGDAPERRQALPYRPDARQHRVHQHADQGREQRDGRHPGCQRAAVGLLLWRAGGCLRGAGRAQRSVGDARILMLLTRHARALALAVSMAEGLAINLLLSAWVSVKQDGAATLQRACYALLRRPPGPASVRGAPLCRCALLVRFAPLAAALAGDARAGDVAGAVV